MVWRACFPAEIISHAIWLDHLFSISPRGVELLLPERDVVVSYETDRRWCEKFGKTFANCPPRRGPRTGDEWIRIVPSRHPCPATAGQQHGEAFLHTPA